MSPSSQTPEDGGCKISLSASDLPGIADKSARKLIQVFGKGSGTGMRVKKISSGGKLIDRVLHLISVPDKSEPGHSISILAIFKENPSKRDQQGNKNFLLMSEISRITTRTTTRAQKQDCLG